ncbi:DEAD/DEAH box helicase [Pseudomonas putida]|uniref:DEAD/DEAH box helicase n=1 Tax=Pseudomonas putida TaxID=303 RepID=UPI001623F52C|nr:DEAD/DEAH box helicase [Pseudomonas putida]EKT4471316.1 DEAD/DEAH box helicase [Pseudomonas putida]EKT4494136.1 DEAD/DEAH box helicase [Pseudomonas putida]EKT8865022.1 DEAD/DEAH box helicase [Pseudomonas putida]QNG07669.1 ATP-dependent helicase [Pseudomonas putida]HDS1060071.1 DEAD/DEAH box helicase [Pseudomonas putida]
MGLMDIFRSLIGERDGALSTQQGFQSQPDSNGLNFFMPTPAFQALQTGQGSALAKVQLIVFNMLTEQGIAETTANGFHIGAEDVSGMDLEQAEILRLPRRLPGRFLTSISGRTGNSGFRVAITLEMPDGAASFTRKGPYLFLTSSECYWLTPAEMMGLQAWERHEALLPEQRGEAANLRLMAELQTAARSGMRIDLSHFERLDVVVPENIGVIATRLPDGSLQLCPSLGDGSTADQLEKRWSQLDMTADGGVLRIDNRVLLVDQARMEGIRNVLANKRIPANQVNEFIATPTAFLDAALVNLEVGFSARVAGIGKLQHMDFGALDATKNDWFALDKRPAPAAILGKLIQSPEDLQRFEGVLQAANEQGATSVAFAGEVIDISDAPAVQQELAKARQNMHPVSDSESRDEEYEPPEGKEKVGVILKDADEINSALLHKAAAATPLTVPDWSVYARQPFPHQREGIEWMLKLMGAALQDEADDLYRLQGGLLADDMGLGKTYMSLVTVGEYLASQRAADKPQKPVLVVAPLSLLENWEDEVGKTFAGIPFRDVVVLQSGRSLRDYRVNGAERESVQLASMIDDSSGMMDEQSIRYALHVGPEAGVHRLDMDRRLVLTTYQTLRDYQFSLCRIDWGVVIFDEAQNIKNPNALQTIAAKGLKADFKLLATGTPVENSLGDFWCLMHTVQPGLLGGWENFRDTWIKPILAASDDERDEVRTYLGEQLRRAVGIFMLRRVKEDQLKGLPTKTILSGVEQADHGLQRHATQLGVVMKGNQLQIYDEVLNSYRARRASAEDMRGTALAALTQLRSISLHPRLENEPALYSEDGKQARQLMMESGKLAVMLQLLDEIRSKGEKVILFMMTKRLQRVLKLWLDQIYGLNVSVINGDTKAVATRAEDMTRKRMIAEFEAHSGFNVLIMSPVAAGVGLTVIGANHVVHLERHWNPAKEAQASDRVYRIGQTKPVFIHLPAVTHPQFDSFDVHLDRLLRGKLMLKDAVVTPESVSEGEMIQSMGL